jgi:hypothetical protein
VVTVGETAMPVPWLTVPTDPTPLSIEPDVALVELNVRLALCPAVMVGGVAVKVAVGAAVDPPLLDDDPPQLDSTIVKPKSTTEDFARPPKQRLTNFLTTVKRPIAPLILVVNPNRDVSFVSRFRLATLTSSRLRSGDSLPPQGFGPVMVTEY